MLYRGFSSFEYLKNRTFSLYDKELVKMDLLNHIFTRKGERVMMPDFGTSIPDLVHEPLTPELVDKMKNDIIRVIDYDPRVERISVDAKANYQTKSVEVSALIRYIELNMEEVFYLNIDIQ